MLKAKKDKQPVPTGRAKPAKGGAKNVKSGTASLCKGKYVS